MKKLICIMVLLVVTVVLNAQEVVATYTTYSIEKGYKSPLNVSETKIVSYDTILATEEQARIEERITESGKSSFKGTYLGKNIYVSKRDANDILEGSQRAIVFARYNTGEYKRYRLIALR